jgi:AP endonuclease-2
MDDIDFLVNKKGPNQGRRFYVCPRPGPVATKEQPRSGQILEDIGRCNFFQWRNGSSKDASNV